MSRTYLTWEYKTEKMEMLWINWWVWVFTPSQQVCVPTTSLQGSVKLTSHPQGIQKAQCENYTQVSFFQFTNKN